jgi:preprotein translocase subunit SecF
MALAAILAVIHDVFITVGIYAVVGFDVTPATIIGFLTIMGYSLYERLWSSIRFAKTPNRLLPQANQHIRMLLTWLSTRQSSAQLTLQSLRFYRSDLFSLLALACLVRELLKDLSLSLFIGLAVGTYSSIFIAPPFLASLREKRACNDRLA